MRPQARANAVLAAALLLVGFAPRARAFEFHDGRLQIHGYFEEQIRALGQDFSWSDDIDLAQWYNVLSTEIEYDIAPDGIGPFDVLSSFARIEVRYDCIWTRGCGMFPSVNAFGDRAEHLPGYKTSGRRTGMSGGLSIEDQVSRVGIREHTARFTALRYRPVLDPREVTASHPEGTNDATYLPSNSRRPMRIDQLDGFTGLFGVNGANGIFEGSGRVSAPFRDPVTERFTAINDDAAYFYFSRQLRCMFGSRKTPGGANGIANQIIGPIDPRCKIDPTGALIDKPNPFNSADLNPIVVNPGTGELVGGSAEMPARPASEVPYLEEGRRATSQGVFYPSGAYREFLRGGKSSIFDQNFSASELAWNRGGSQQDEKEFKEGYLDMEFFDSRLWVRLGKQNIVWGKTELFRTTDQFNPQDVALASLASLEETRIALWSVRSVWSFYDVGPLEDLRLELSANLDDFEPADIGRCGEAFTVLVACNKTTALWAHGLFGVALAGENRPDSWWKDPQGLEYGARLEFRAGRFSFQISDFYGYEDFPFVNRLNSYENRKDPVSGRPLEAHATGSCTTGNESACLKLRSNLNDDGSLRFSEDYDGDGRIDTVNEDTSGDGVLQQSEDLDLDGHFDVGEDRNSNGVLDPGEDLNGNGTLELVETGDVDGDGAIESGPADPTNREYVLNNHAGNIQIFAAICATSIGFNSNDTRACGQSVFNSKAPLTALGQGVDIDARDRKTQVSIASLLSNTLAGNGPTVTIVRNNFTDGTPVPYVQPNRDPCDSFLSDGDGTCASARPGRTGTGYANAGPLTARGSLNQVLTDEQEALLGCGPFWGTDCEADGMDLLNAEASVMMQSFPGFEGDYGDYIASQGFRGYSIGGVDDQGNPLPVPGTTTFNGGLPGSRWYQNRTVQLPGARGPDSPDYNPNVDGCVRPGPAGCEAAVALRVPVINTGVISASPLYQPHDFGVAAGLPFRSEMAALSWNFLMTLVAFSQSPDPALPDNNQFAPADPMRTGPGQCSYAQPQYCSSVQSFFSISGAQRNSVRAGGTGEFGRRDFQWHAGGEGVLDYQKRNVLGFSLDFAEDYTKSNWGAEATWISNVRFTDNDSMKGVNTGDTFNLTVSVDRPTFINFLNPNRTFFFNSQVFFQYISNYRSGFTTNGPFNMLGTFTVQTGYFQDRLLPGVTFVYDINSNSGAALPSITYRFTESFSATVGMNFFWGRWEFEDQPIAPLGTIGSEVGKLAYQDGVENGLAVVRERDELFLRIRYTF